MSISELMKEPANSFTNVSVNELKANRTELSGTLYTFNGIFNTGNFELGGSSIFRTSKNSFQGFRIVQQTDTGVISPFTLLQNNIVLPNRPERHELQLPTSAQMFSQLGPLATANIIDGHPLILMVTNYNTQPGNKFTQSINNDWNINNNQANITFNLGKTMISICYDSISSKWILD
jgi:hypothetical protein